MNELHDLIDNKRRNIITFKVYGKRALFAEPIMHMSGEKLSLQYPTYEALKGICESIYWRPTLIWVVEKVRIMNPIEMYTEGVRLLKADFGPDLSYYTYLLDPCYIVQAHFTWNYKYVNLENDRNINKHSIIAQRALRSGGRRTPYLGTSECNGYVEPCKFEEGEGFYDGKSIDFGYGYHGITYNDELYSSQQPSRATVDTDNVEMKNGVIVFNHPLNCDHRKINDIPVKNFGKPDIKEEVGA